MICVYFIYFDLIYVNNEMDKYVGTPLSVMYSLYMYLHLNLIFKKGFLNILSRFLLEF